MFSVENPRVKNGDLPIDATEIDLKKRINVNIWDMVVMSAEILQEENDVPFEVGDVIFHPGKGELFEVKKVFDNRQRTSLGEVTLTCSKNNEFFYFPATKVLHLGYLISAHMPYNEKVGIISGQDTDEVCENLLSAINHFLKK